MKVPGYIENQGTPSKTPLALAGAPQGEVTPGQFIFDVLGGP